MALLKNSKDMCHRIGLFLLLLLVLVFLNMAKVHGQFTPYATYESHIKVDTSGNGTISVTYSIFAGNQPLHVSTQEVQFPTYNFTTVLMASIRIYDMYGQNLTWTRDVSGRFLIVTIGPLDIPAGGKYGINLNYDQSSLCKIIGGTYYFVYEWDFTQIGQTPYTVSQYTLAFERPADGFFDSYPVTYIGASPTNLISYMTQSGSTITFNYMFSTPDVTLNVYYNHVSRPMMFVWITLAFFFVLIVAIALYVAIRRRGS